MTSPPEPSQKPRTRRIKLSRRGMLFGLTAFVAITGAYLLWRSPSLMPAGDPQVRFFQIATGSTAGTYFPVGQMIASIISQPVGAGPCGEVDRCGVPGLLAVVKSSQGSIANIRNVSVGHYDAALAQADVAFWAHSGTGVFATDRAYDDLRAIAGLYPESVQLVASRASAITSLADLRGKRVSIDRPGSGTRTDALLILQASGLTPGDFSAVEVEVSRAADMLLAQDLDAFFLVAGTPSIVVTDLASRADITLVPIAGPAIDQLRADSRFFVEDVIAPNTYRGIGRTKTLSVKALLVTSAKVSETLIHDITAALWRKGNRDLLDNGHIKGRLIRLETAQDGIPIPLHRGAAQYYRSIGRLK
ncbi:MAG: TAXI family TRAP transporter solute-binding subunit [Alphaproteobacteria bacterium]